MLAHPTFDIADILRRIHAGDTQAFAVVVSRFQRPLFAFLGRMGLSQAQAEEIAQESFLRAWRHLGQYQPQRGEFSTWLFTIARNLALNEASRAANVHEIAVGDEFPEMVCERPQPAEALVRGRQRQRLDAALGQLPLADRCLIALAYIEDLDLAEIARIEECTVGAIKTRLHRVRTKLSTLLENDDA